eukprot:PITA_03909
MEHLLNLCQFTSTLWNWVASIFRQTDRDIGSINRTLRNWRRNFSENEIINKAWALVLGFLIWDVWKEHNNRIFKNRIGTSQSIMTQIIRQLKETGLFPQGISKTVSHITVDKDIWQPPPHGFMKCNIDGASKGNPGMAGYGGVIRYEQGFIKAIFHSHLGKATNNMANLMALEQCLEILRDSNLHNTIIEADSELIINLIKKICNGLTSDKVSKHWRLLQVYQLIQSHLHTMRTLSFINVRRTTNKLADILANEGVLCAKSNKRYDWIGTP